MTQGEVYDRIFKCLFENLIGGFETFETDGGAIGLLGPRDDETETRPVYVLTLAPARLEVADSE